MKCIDPVLRPDSVNPDKESPTRAAAFLPFHEPWQFSAVPAAGSGEELSAPMKILCKVSEQRKEIGLFLDGSTSLQPNGG